MFGMTRLLNVDEGPLIVEQSKKHAEVLKQMLEASVSTTVVPTVVPALDQPKARRRMETEPKQDQRCKRQWINLDLVSQQQIQEL